MSVVLWIRLRGFSALRSDSPLFHASPGLCSVRDIIELLLVPATALYLIHSFLKRKGGIKETFFFCPIKF